MGYEWEILVGIIIGIIIVLIIIAGIFEILFPKNKFSKMLEHVAEWIKDNISF